VFTPAERSELRDALVAAARADELDAAELARAFGVATETLLTEMGHIDAALAERLAGPLRELAALPAARAD
jgi:hypothetical protein